MRHLPRCGVCIAEEVIAINYCCEQCCNDVDDNGPYERPDGEHMCQDCMEKGIIKADLIEE